VDGLVPAVWIGAAVLFAGALVALLVPSQRSQIADRRSQEVAASAAA
jgi:hypothetical protein